MVEPGGTISPYGKIFENFLVGGKNFAHYRGKISFSITFPRHVFDIFFVDIFQGGGK